VANRDENGHAQGKLFIDKGFSVKEIEDGDYEHYEFHLSANSLKKWILNEKSQKSVGVGIDKLVITNAKDLQDTDFACFTAQKDHVTTNLSFKYDDQDKTLSIFSPRGNINSFTFRDIHFGNSKRNINICNPQSQFYHIKSGKVPSLDRNSATMILESAAPGALRDLKLELTLLRTGVVNMHWTFAST